MLSWRGWRLAVAGTVFIFFHGAALAAATSGPDPHVHVLHDAFDPPLLRIPPGQTVDWDVHDDLSAHTVTATDTSYDSGRMSIGDTFLHTYLQPGTYNYLCTIHGFTGKVHVNDPDATPDLIVDRITSRNEGPSIPGGTTIPSGQVAIFVTVKNTAPQEAAPSTLRLAYHHGTGTHDIGTIEFPLLGPNEKHTKGLLWDATGKIGDFVVEAIADIDGAVAESNEANNSRTATVSVMINGIPGVDPTTTPDA